MRVDEQSRVPAVYFNADIAIQDQLSKSYFSFNKSYRNSSNSRSNKWPFDCSINSRRDRFEVDQSVEKRIPDALMQEGEFCALEVVEVAAWDFELAFESDELDDLWWRCEKGEVSSALSFEERREGKRGSAPFRPSCTSSSTYTRSSTLLPGCSPNNRTH